LPTEHEARDPRLLARATAQHGVTHVHSIPSHYALLAESCTGGELVNLKLVSVGGEPMPPQLVRRHLADYPNATLLNDYGPTEATVWAAAHRCTVGDSTASLVPIGRPLPGYRAYVLDDQLRLAPPGLVGELYIGGAALARGYHGRPGLTAARFLPDPFGDAPGGRLYRTGDLARHRSDGALDILGRVDSQVKVRGFRVELGEIERTVLRHPDVAEAAVVVHSGPGDVVRLACFVAGLRDDLSTDALRSWLAAQLPAYLHPDVVTVLDVLPRTRNGKVDTALLREADQAPPQPAGGMATGQRSGPAVEDLSTTQVDALLRGLLIGRQ
jgi:acyl-coenzyme A synthetase/AMP-(fatty) acid ligase